MKKAMSFTLFLVFLCGLTLSLSGCKKQKEPDPSDIQISEGAITSSSEQLMDEKASMDHTAEVNVENISLPRTLRADLEKNLTIDALVNAPESTDLSLPFIRVHSFVADGQKVCQSLFPDDRIKDERTYPGYPGAISFELDGEKYVTINTGTVSAVTPLGEFVTQLYALEWILNDETLQHPDLSFASRDEVVGQTLAVLSEIGLNNVQCTEVYALSAELLQNASNNLASQPNYLEDIRENRIAYKENWTIDDECYVLEMQYVIGNYNLPVFSEHGTETFALTEIHYEDYMLEAVVSKDGIISLRIIRAFEETEQGRVAAIIPVENVVNLISNYYQNIIVEYPTVIREIVLNYILLPIEGENTYELTPSWCCKVVSQYGSEDECETSWIVFDAITGQVHY